MVAWLSKSGAELIGSGIAQLSDELVAHAARRGFSVQHDEVVAWNETLTLLQNAFGAVTKRATLDQSHVLIEYEIPRRGRRIDAVLILGSALVVVEMKVGAQRFDRAATLQLLDYVRDLRDFHVESQGIEPVPVLVATAARESNRRSIIEVEGASIRCISSANDLALIIEDVTGNQQGAPINPETWDTSLYRPSPGIIEAAVELFAGHEVRSISHAWADNLSDTVDAIQRNVDLARNEHRRIALFVTGVPGSGKTLAGLSAVHQPTLSSTEGRNEHSGPRVEVGSYLSGNGPLVEVLQYALSADLASRGEVSKAESKRRASTFIQPVHLFIREHVSAERIPPEHVIVFDEAQRAWNSSQMFRKEGVDASEALLLLRAMGRVPDWAVVVALVGQGQEINRGEAGLEAWAEALRGDDRWTVAAAPDVISCFSGLTVRVERDLHLSVSVRSPRARHLSLWVDALVEGRLDAAAEAAIGLDEYPIFITRNLGAMRAYLSDRSRPDLRTGLLASSQALRLRPFGIEMNSAFQGAIDWPRWFVDDQSDIRSSYALEVAASEFKCQGLEIDWAGLCWGDDLTWNEEKAQWRTRRLRGSAWVEVSDSTYAKNRYRVLLTRARYGLVIWVPSPDRDELLIDGSQLDMTYEALRRVGGQELG